MKNFVGGFDPRAVKRFANDATQRLEHLNGQSIEELMAATIRRHSHISGPKPKISQSERNFAGGFDPAALEKAKEQLDGDAADRGFYN